MTKLFNNTIDRLTDMTGARMQKQNMILSNVANIDTPGYRPAEMTFSKALQSADNLRIARTDPGHLKGKKEGSGTVDYEMKVSDGPVKLDAEMAGLAENQLLYNATVEILARKFRAIQSTLREAK